MNQILFDTDVLIEHLRNNSLVTSQLQSLLDEGSYFAYSVVSDAEIFYGAKDSEMAQLEDFLSLFDCVELSKMVSRQAAQYLKKYAKSHGMKLADACIAATAKVKGLSLCSFNMKHFPMKDITFLKLKRA